MSESSGSINVSYRGIGIIVLMILSGLGITGVSGFQLSTGASDAATEDIRKTIQSVIDTDSLMTPEEATEWADERDQQKHRQEHIDETLEQHTGDITEIKEDVHRVEQVVNANQEVLQSIAERVGADQ